jgi:hypothetical protein
MRWHFVKKAFFVCVWNKQHSTLLLSQQSRTGGYMRCSQVAKRADKGEAQQARSKRNSVQHKHPRHSAGAHTRALARALADGTADSLCNRYSQRPQGARRSAPCAAAKCQTRHAIAGMDVTGAPPYAKPQEGWRVLRLHYFDKRYWERHTSNERRCW